VRRGVHIRGLSAIKIALRTTGTKRISPTFWIALVATKPGEWDIMSSDSGSCMAIWWSERSTNRSSTPRRRAATCTPPNASAASAPRIDT
jgi:hypothetical protein